MTVRPELGIHTGFCAVASANLPTNDTSQRFSGQRNGPVPTACPPLP